MESEQRGIPPPEPPQSPDRKSREPLSDNEMNNLISAIGNLEPKAILVGSMRPGVIYSMGDLNRLLISSQGDNIGWEMNYAGGFQYCQRSLAPIGLVAQEILDQQMGTLGYMKTKKGEDDGDALAGLLLDFSLKHPQFSLRDFFGNSNSGSNLNSEEGVEWKNRAPEARRKIFWELLTCELPTRAKDICDSTGLNKDNVSTYLDDLSKRKIIQYEALKSGKANVPFKFTRGSEDFAYTYVRGRKKATEFAISIMKAEPDKEWNYENIAEKYLESEGREKSDKNLKTMAGMFSDVLNHLSTQGVVKYESALKGTEKHSDINLTNEQTDIIFELVDLLDNFQSQNPKALEYGRIRLTQILANPSSVSSLMQKAKEHSTNANRMPKEESDHRFLQIISSNPGATPDQIYDTLSSEGTKNKAKSVKSILHRLVKEGKITEEVIRGVKHFKVTDSLDSSVLEDTNSLIDSI